MKSEVNAYFNENVYGPARSLAAVISGFNSAKTYDITRKVSKTIDFDAEGRGAPEESLSYNWKTRAKDGSLFGYLFKKEGRGHFINQAIGGLETAVQDMIMYASHDLSEVKQISQEDVSDARRYLEEALKEIARYADPNGHLMKVNTAKKPEFRAAQQSIADAKLGLERVIKKYDQFLQIYSQTGQQAIYTLPQQQSKVFSPWFAVRPLILPLAALAIILSAGDSYKTKETDKAEHGLISQATQQPDEPKTEAEHGIKINRGESFAEVAGREGKSGNDAGKLTLALQKSNGLVPTPQNDVYSVVDGKLIGSRDDPRPDGLIDFPDKLGIFPDGKNTAFLKAPANLK